MMAIDQGAYPPGEMKARSDQMIERAEHVFEASPNHPGAAHYLIHVSDIDPSFTNRSLPAARAYARIAPDASHALHMPSHVFLRLGLWNEVARSNERSWAASRREMARDHLGGAEVDAHSLQFLAYAYLEGGRWRDARALIDSARRVIGNADVSSGLHVDARYAISELSFLMARETGRWNEVVAPPPDRPPSNPREQGFIAIARYARAVTQAMRGDTTGLAASTAVARHRADSLGSAAPAADYVAAELEALLAGARGDETRAIERLTHAADFEDHLPLVGPPSFLSARELLGDAYLKARRADSAAAQYERALAKAPNRSAALLGLARARLALGDRDAARNAYARLMASWQRADADVPALAEVRAGASDRRGSR
jgi:tetratricopeptide (TPR) repeat protein